jgi:hypothetical protein
MSSSPGGGTLAQELRRLPDRLYSADGFGGEVVGADEQRVIVQGLSAWRLIISVVETDQSIP